MLVATIAKLRRISGASRSIARLVGYADAEQPRSAIDDGVAVRSLDVVDAVRTWVRGTSRGGVGCGSADLPM